MFIDMYNPGGIMEGSKVCGVVLSANPGVKRELQLHKHSPVPVCISLKQTGVF